MVISVTLLCPQQSAPTPEAKGTNFIVNYFLMVFVFYRTANKHKTPRKARLNSDRAIQSKAGMVFKPF